jgi:polyhydroxybutyrate depolymerase
MASDGISPLYRRRVWLIAATLGMGSVLFFQRSPTKEAINADVFPRETIRVGDLEREFRVVVPFEQATGPMPVVFAFHGMGDSTDSMAEYSGLDRTAAQNGFLLVYPATRRFSWANHVSESSPVEANPDLTFFDALLSHVEQKFKIDSERIYVAGMSNGASFVQLLAAHRKNIAAVVAHSGPSPIEIGRMSRRFPILLMTGADDSVADDVQVNAEQYRQAGFDCDFVSVAGLGHEWADSQNTHIWEFLSRHKVSQ